MICDSKEKICAKIFLDLLRSRKNVEAFKWKFSFWKSLRKNILDFLDFVLSPKANFPKFSIYIIRVFEVQDLTYQPYTQETVNQRIVLHLIHFLKEPAFLCSALSHILFIKECRIQNVLHGRYDNEEVSLLH